MHKFSLDVLRDEKAPALALLAVVLRQYGVEALEQQPEFLRQELDSDFGVTLTDLQSDKIQAAIVVLTTDLFESQWEVFKTVCHLLNGTPDSFEDTTPLEAEELALALAHYDLIRGEDDKPAFSHEVLQYAGTVFYHYGMSEAAAIFPLAMMPSSVVTADPTEKNQALSAIYDARLKDIREYIGSLAPNA